MKTNEKQLAEALDKLLFGEEIQSNSIENKDDLQELESLSKIYNELPLYKNEAIPITMDLAFENMLNEEKEAVFHANKYIFEENANNNTSSHNWLKYAAVLAGLVLTFILGRQSVQPKIELASNVEKPIQIKYVDKIVEKPVIKTVIETKYLTNIEKKPIKINNEPSQAEILEQLATLQKDILKTKELVLLGLLSQESSADRLKGVNQSVDLPLNNEKVLVALLNTLDNDPNLNVRLATADAISRYGKFENVRTTLIKSILKQNEPSMQLALLALITNLNEKRALPALKLLVENEDTDTLVKQKIEKSMVLLAKN